MLIYTACSVSTQSSSLWGQSPRHRLQATLQIACLVIGALLSGASLADRRISIVDDPRGYVEVVGLFEDGGQFNTRINQGDFFYGWHSRKHGYLGCAQFESTSGSVCGKTDAASAEVNIVAMNVGHSPESTDCVRGNADDFMVFYSCPEGQLPIPHCTPRESDGGKYALCEVIGDTMIRELNEVGIEILLGNIDTQREAVEKFNSGFRAEPIEVQYELLGGDQTLESWIGELCCRNGKQGFALLDQAAELEAQQSTPEVEESQEAIEQPEPQVTQSDQQIVQENSEPEPIEPQGFPHKKVRRLAITSASVVILLVLLVVGTTYMRSRHVA